MKRIPAIFLQAAIILIGIVALALLLWEPHLEGRNAHATLYEIYFRDPFLVYVYIGSVPFFAALYQGFKVLGNMIQDKIFSQSSQESLRKIRHCAMVVVAFISGAEAYFFLFRRSEDDIAGGVAIGLSLIFGSLVIAATANVCEQIIEKAMRVVSDTA